MSTNSKVSNSTGIFALCFCFALILLGVTWYLMRTNQALDVQASALTPSWFYIKPAFVEGVIVSGGFFGTLAAVSLNSFNALVYAGISFSAIYFLFHGISKPDKSGSVEVVRQRPIANGENKAEIPGCELMVMLPNFVDPENGEERNGHVDSNPYRQVFYRIARKKTMVSDSSVQSPHNSLYLAIYEMLNGHRDVPASIGGHHADTDLFEHSKAVSKKVIAFYKNKGLKEPLAAISGLAHDLDKLLSYKRNGDVWTKNVKATHHNKFAAYIVSTQPEFRALPEDDRNVLTLALRYYHDPENLPLGATQRVETLIKALRLSDGFAIQEEKAAGVQNIEADSLSIIDQALIATLSELNINGYLSKAEHTTGWTTPALEYVLTPMSAVIEKIGKHLTGELVRKLQLDHETRTFNHPASKILGERFASMNVLMTAYKNFKSDRGLYNVRIGNTRFKAVLMLEKRVLSPLIPGLIEKWDTAPYSIRITGATEDNTVQGESDIEAKEEEA